MTLRAKVEATWDDGSAKTFRDEDGGLWLVSIDPGDGTLAVEEIHDGHDDPRDAATIGMTPCGIATWDADGVSIERASSHGENYTDGTEYTGPNGEEYRARPSGWGYPRDRSLDGVTVLTLSDDPDDTIDG